MLDLIDLFGEKTTQDELDLERGGGAFADQKFPGTTTIQTRAKYFLFDPWMYLDLEWKQVLARAIANISAQFEVRRLPVPSLRNCW